MKYYLHDTNSFSDEKVTLLFIEFGYEGVGLFYVILERLALQEKPVSEKVLKTQLKIGKKLNKCLQFMYKIEILSVKNGDVFNENILKFSEKYKIKKEKTRKRVSEWRDKQADEETVTRYEHVRNSPKVKLSKVKESKVNKIPTYEDFKIHAIEKCKVGNLLFNESKLRLKYDSWVENGWKDGNNKPVKNWKAKLTNTLSYIFEEKTNKNINKNAITEDSICQNPDAHPNRMDI